MSYALLVLVGCAVLSLISVGELPIPFSQMQYSHSYLQNQRLALTPADLDHCGRSPRGESKKKLEIGAVKIGAVKIGALIPVFTN